MLQCFSCPNLKAEGIQGYSILCHKKKCNVHLLVVTFASKASAIPISDYVDFKL